MINMENIKEKMAKVEKFFNKNNIKYHYVDYKTFRDKCTSIQVIVPHLSGSDMMKIDKEYTLFFVYPFTNKHLNIELDIEFI